MNHLGKQTSFAVGRRGVRTWAAPSWDSAEWFCKVGGWGRRATGVCSRAVAGVVHHAGRGAVWRILFGYRSNLRSHGKRLHEYAI